MNKGFDILFGVILICSALIGVIRIPKRDAGSGARMQFRLPTLLFFVVLSSLLIWANIETGGADYETRFGNSKAIQHISYRGWPCMWQQSAPDPTEPPSFSLFAFAADILLCGFLLVLGTTTFETMLRWHSERRRWFELFAMVNPLVWIFGAIVVVVLAFRALIAISQ